MRMALIVCSTAVLIAACGQDAASPTSPTVADLAFSVASVTLPRYTSIQTTVLLRRSGGAAEDVTVIATWSSSAPDIVTVQAGLVTAIGVGTARVTASHGGLTGTLDVVARRNTRPVGAITVEARELNGIQAVQADLDGRLVNGQSFSGTRTSWAILIGQEHWARYDTTVAPGTHTLSARVILLTRPDLQVRGASHSASFVEVRDSDTDEVLARISLPVQEQTGQLGSSFVDFAWPLQIEIFR